MLIVEDRLVEIRSCGGSARCFIRGKRALGRSRSPCRAIMTSCSSIKRGGSKAAYGARGNILLAVHRRTKPNNAGNMNRIDGSIVYIRTQHRV